jgi:tetratricopeptide (TPR) repeat protein
LALVTIDFWTGSAFLPWLRPSIYPSESLWPRRIQIGWNWLLACFIAELPIIIILSAGGRHPNQFHFIGILLYNIACLNLIYEWPGRRIVRAIQNHRYDRAMKLVRFWKQRRPYWPIFAYLEARILYHKERYAEAVDLLEKALTECPNQVFASLVLSTFGICYEKLEKFYKALEVYSAQVEINPHNALGYGAMAEPYADQLPNPHRALEMINVSIEQLALNPKDVQHTVEFGVMLWAIRGYILQQLGNTQQATEALDRAWAVPLDKHKSALACLQHRTGLVMLERGETAHALTYLQQAVATDPKSPSGKQAAEKLQELRDQPEIPV